MEASTSERTLLEELGLVPSPEKCRELARAWDRIRTAAIRGAAAGALIKGGLHTFTFVMYMLSRLRGKGRQRLLTLGDMLHDTCLHTCFLAILGSSYTLTDEAIALVFGKESTQRWRALVAGLVAGQSLRITGPRQRHYSLATYILLRGLTLLVRTGNKPSAPPALRALLRPTRLAHGDTLLMCAAASQILYSFIMEPSSLPPSYVRFISRMGGKEPAVWAAFREHALRNAAGQPPGPLASLARTHLAHLNARPGLLRPTPCDFFHPGQSCCGHALSVLPPAYSTALSVYVPFYAVSSVLVHRTALLARPAELLPKMALGVVRSSAFLAAYMAAAFAGACLGFNMAGINTGPVIAASVWVGGLATLIEKKSRRMELAMYCAARALEAFIRCWRQWTSASSADRRFAARAAPAAPAARAYVRPPAGAAGLRPLPPRAGAHLFGAAHSHSHARSPLHASSPSAAAASAASASAASGSGWLRLDVLLFSLGCGAIMHCYSDACGQHRDVFRSKYLNVLDFVFGNEGLQRGSISHVPTNRELVSTVGRRIRTMSRGVMPHAPSGGAASAVGSGGGFAGDYSPLQRSPEQSQSDGLCAMRGRLASGGGFGAVGGGGLSAASSSCAFGHGHHGGHGYSEYLQQRQHEPPSSPYCTAAAAVATAAGPLPALGPAAAALTASASSVAAAMSQDGSAASLPMSPVHGLTGEGSVALPAPAAAAAGGGYDTTYEAAARLAAQLPPREQHAGQAARGGGRGSDDASSSSGGGCGSSSGSGWEDVWAAATGSAPNAAAVGAAAGAAAAAAAAQTVGEIQAAALAGASECQVDGGAPPAAATSSGGGGALGWAARLVAGALGGSRAGSRAGSSAALAAAEAAPLAAAPVDDCGGPGAGGRTGAPRHLAAALGGSSLRRIATAPQVLLLLADPAAERSGRGRSSYQQLQKLSSDDGVSVVESGGDADGASSSSGLSAPAAAAAVGRASAGGGSSSLSGSPLRVVPVPSLPNAASRTPAFRSSVRPPAAAPMGAGAWPWGRRDGARPLPPRRGRAGGGVASGMDQLASSAPAGPPSRLGATTAAGATPAAEAEAECDQWPPPAGRSVPGLLTLAPRGGWSHTSPVQGAAAWPRFSIDAGAVAEEEQVRAAAASLGAAAEEEAEEELSRSAP